MSPSLNDPEDAGCDFEVNHHVEAHAPASRRRAREEVSLPTGTTSSSSPTAETPKELNLRRKKEKQQKPGTSQVPKFGATHYHQFLALALKPGNLVYGPGVHGLTQTRLASLHAACCAARIPVGKVDTMQRKLGSLIAEYEAQKQLRATNPTGNDESLFPLLKGEVGSLLEQLSTLKQHGKVRAVRFFSISTPFISFSPPAASLFQSKAVDQKTLEKQAAKELRSDVTAAAAAAQATGDAHAASTSLVQAARTTATEKEKARLAQKTEAAKKTRSTHGAPPDWLIEQETARQATQHRQLQVDEQRLAHEKRKLDLEEVKILMEAKTTDPELYKMLIGQWRAAHPLPE